MSWAWVLFASNIFIDIFSVWLFHLSLLCSSHCYIIIYINTYHCICTPITSNTNLSYFSCFSCDVLRRKYENMHCFVFISLSLLTSMSMKHRVQMMLMSTDEKFLINFHLHYKSICFFISIVKFEKWANICSRMA